MSALDRIVARKRDDLRLRMEEKSLERLREAAKPTRRSFAESLRRDGPAFILECKKASPSKGLIRADFDLEEIARVYGRFADCVSVLTDEPYFHGSFENLRRMRVLVDKPLLCKDFIVSPYQVYEARVHGADAVLLMLSVLGDAAYAACAEAARELAMDVLTEVHDEAELARALALDARIIGINNRDLNTLKVDLDTTRKLAAQIPGDRIKVCESGIETHRDVRRFDTSVDAFLVGGSLMREPRLDLAVRRLLFGGVKVCGLTSVADAEAAYRWGASFGGLIFAAHSKRRVSQATAAEIAAQTALPLAGVFVNEPTAAIADLATRLGLSAVQLHGDETPEAVAELRSALSSACEIWKAFGVTDRLPDFAAYDVDRIVLDATDGNARGGTGRQFDWRLLDAVDQATRDRAILAGGIGPRNVAAASGKRCWMIDVNSGVEFPGQPGKKDKEVLEDLFVNLRRHGKNAASPHRIERE